MPGRIVTKDDIVPGKWYVMVPPLAPPVKPDQTYIGPFDSQDEAEEHLTTHFSGRSMRAIMKIEIPPITTID
jgi:hypothetical protein